MATNISLQQEAPVAGDPALQRVRGSGWRGGFGNMLMKELDDWFGTRQWLVQSIVWLAIINGFIAFIFWVVPLLEQAGPGQTGGGAPASESFAAMGLQLFYSFAVQLGAIGVIILAQDEIVGEKQSGTAQWILSKPVSRTAFVLSKLTATAIGVLIFIVGLPALVAYGEIALAQGKPIDVLPFVGGLGIVALVLLFYLTLTIMLGVLFDQRGPVLGISLGLMFMSILVSSFVPQIKLILPVDLQNAATGLAQGQALSEQTWITMAACVIWSVVFTAVALWRFQREEF